MIAWLQHTPERQQELLGLASSRSGLPAGAIEKDWWVTLALNAIFQTPWAAGLVFKGGTSLSKSWGLIDRFSEDIDLVLDRAILGYPEDLSKTKIKALRSVIVCDKLKQNNCLHCANLDDLPAFQYKILDKRIYLGKPWHAQYKSRICEPDVSVWLFNIAEWQ